MKQYLMTIVKDFYKTGKSHHTPVIDDKSQMILSYLKMFRENKRDKNWESMEDMVDNFINEMKSLYCPVYAFHERKFDELWARTHNVDSIYTLGTFSEH